MVKMVKGVSTPQPHPINLYSPCISHGQLRAGFKTDLFTEACGHLWELLLKTVLIHITIRHYTLCWVPHHRQHIVVVLARRNVVHSKCCRHGSSSRDRPAAPDTDCTWNTLHATASHHQASLLQPPSHLPQSPRHSSDTPGHTISLV